MMLCKEWLQDPSYSYLGETLGLDVYTDQRNERLIIKDAGSAGTPLLLAFLSELPERLPWLGKVILFSRQFRWKELVARGYRVEGLLNNYYQGKPAVLVTKYFDSERLTSTDVIEEDKLLEDILNKGRKVSAREIPIGMNFGNAEPAHIPNLVELYQKVFPRYPTPITDAEYIKKGLGSRYVFQVAFDKDRIIGAASAEIDPQNKAAEITDCATLPEYRGLGLMYRLVNQLEQEMKSREIYNLFSLARAKSPGINRVFYNHGYHYGGRLINNCDICTGYEDINIWEKKLTI